MSLLPASVNLGCDGAAVYDPTTGGHITTCVPAPFGVMKFEPFAALMQTLLTWLDTHEHPSAVGLTGPPVIPSTPSVAPGVPLIRSIRVGVGL